MGTSLASMNHAGHHQSPFCLGKTIVQDFPAQRVTTMGLSPAPGRDYSRARLRRSRRLASSGPTYPSWDDYGPMHCGFVTVKLQPVSLTPFPLLEQRAIRASFCVAESGFALLSQSERRQIGSTGRERPPADRSLPSSASLSRRLADNPPTRDTTCPTQRRRRCFVWQLFRSTHRPRRPSRGRRTP
jgi:hypothetical protein